MKTKLILFVLLCSISLRSQWSTKTNLTVEMISGSDFISSNEAIIVGCANCISINPPTGIIQKTSDGGNNFNTILTVNDALFHDVFFTGTDTGYVCGLGSSSKGLIYKTTDGGDTWNDLSFPDYSNLNALYFLNSQVGFSAGEYLYKTTDGGLSWTNIYPNYIGALISDVYFTDSLTGYITSAQAGTNGKVYKTLNGGKTWSDITPSSNQGYTSITFLDKQIGIVTANKGRIYKTIDAGAHWTVCKSGTLDNMFAVSFDNPVVGYACGFTATNNVIYRSTDAGSSWTKVYDQSGISLYTITTSSINNVLAGGLGLTVNSNNGGGLTKQATAFITGSDIICSGDSVQIEFHLTGTPPWNIVYTDGTNNYTLNNILTPSIKAPRKITNNTTFYISSFTDNNGPAYYGGIARFSISSSPTVSMTGSKLICDGDSLNLPINISAGNFPWKILIGDQNDTTEYTLYSSIDSVKIHPNQTTNYSLINFSDQCFSTPVSGTFKASVSVEPKLVSDFNILHSEKTIECIGTQQKLILQPKKDVYFKWTHLSTPFKNTNDTLIVNANGTYVAESYCGHHYDTVSVSLKKIKSRLINFDSRMLCNSNFLVLKSIEKQNLKWSTGATNDSIKTNSAGQYSLQAIDTVGCYKNDTINIEPNNALATIHSDDLDNLNICPNKIVKIASTTITDSIIQADDGYLDKLGLVAYTFEKRADENILALDMVDEKIGYTANKRGVTGDIYINSTTDGGHTWYETYKFDGFGNYPSLLAFEGLQFTSQNIGYVMLRGGETGYSTDSVHYKIFKTIDGGLSWKVIFDKTFIQLYDITQKHYYFEFAFANDSTGTFISSNGQVFNTTDGGVIWTNFIRPFVVDTYLAGLYYNNGVAILASYYHVETSIDNFNTSSNALLASGYQGGELIHFVNDKVGFISSTSYGGDKIFKTVDGGKYWTNILPKSSGQFDYNAMGFVNDSIGYIASGSFLLTKDGGSTWNSMTKTIGGVTYPQTIPDYSIAAMDRIKEGKIFFIGKGTGKSNKNYGIIFTNKTPKYTWYFDNTAMPDSTLSHISAKKSGTYYLTTEIDGCTLKSNEITLNYLNLNRKLNYTNGVLSVDQKYSYSYDWYKDGQYLTSTGYSNPNFHPTSNGDYFVGFDAGSNCWLFSDTVSVTIPSNISSIDANNNYIAYPNPSNGSFILKGEHLQGKSLIVYNMLGEVIFEQKNISNNSANINIENINDGMYKVIISDRDENTQHLKLIIKN